MKLYNPILGGSLIKLEDNSSFNQDTFMEFDNGYDMVLKYPFLIKIEEEKYSPDSCEDTRNIPMKEWYSGRATARLADELQSITNGVQKSLEEVKSTIEVTQDNVSSDLARLSVKLSATNSVLEEISQITSQTQEINTKILEELILQRESKFSFKKLLRLKNFNDKK
jgi:hypothetical protein